MSLYQKEDDNFCKMNAAKELLVAGLAKHKLSCAPEVKTLALPSGLENF